MSRYRKVEVKTWSSEDFRALSPMPPSGQGLWFFLMTGPLTGPVPGLFRAGRAGMAEELGWAQEAFDEAFGEVLGKGMVKADLTARVVWLPQAIKYNRPESPNVVRSWRADLDMLPECALKAEALVALRAFLEEMGDGFVAAFDEIRNGKPGRSEPTQKASGKALSKPSGKASPNQEQEQEQEQEKAKRVSSSVPDDLSADGCDEEAQRLAAEAEAKSKAEAKAQRLAAVTSDAIDAYNAALGKPNGLLPAVTLKNDVREKQVKRCLRVASEIAAHLNNGVPTLTRAFWDGYFETAAKDDFHAGRRGGGKDHKGWTPDFDYLTNPETMTKIFDQAMSS